MSDYYPLNQCVSNHKKCVKTKKWSDERTKGLRVPMNSNFESFESEADRKKEGIELCSFACQATSQYLLKWQGHFSHLFLCRKHSYGQEFLFVCVQPLPYFQTSVLKLFPFWCLKLFPFWCHSLTTWWGHLLGISFVNEIT